MSVHGRSCTVVACFVKQAKKEPRPAPSLASSSTAWLTLPLISLLLHMQNLRPPPPHTHTHAHTHAYFPTSQFHLSYSMGVYWDHKTFSSSWKNSTPTISLKQLLASKGFRDLGLCTVDLQTETVYEIEFFP